MSPDPATAETSADLRAVRDHLLSVALPYARSMRSRPGLAGILVYGSLARGRLTPFSDVDLAVFYDDEPPWRIERRLVEGTKVDLIGFPLEDVSHLLHNPPRSMDVGFPFSYVLESLLLADDDSILYDPTGELQRVKAYLRERLSFQELNLVSLSDGYLRFYRVNLEAARSLAKQGDAAGALDKAQWAGNALAFLLRKYTVLKDVREAAEQMGLPEFADAREELASILVPSPDAAAAIWDATRSLWDHTTQVAEPLRGRLRGLGLEQPDRLELVGDYDLFWPGDSLNELGRVMDEVPTSLRWCRRDLDRGRGAEALQHLWGCRGVDGVRQRWDRLAAALKATGYDCSDLIERMLEAAEFARLGKQLERAITAVERPNVDPDAAARALTLTDRMDAMLVRVIPFLSPKELAERTVSPTP